MYDGLSQCPQASQKGVAKDENFTQSLARGQRIVSMQLRQHGTAAMDLVVYGNDFLKSLQMGIALEIVAVQPLPETAGVCIKWRDREAAARFGVDQCLELSHPANVIDFDRQ